jgi:CheY-like chemotaxis protein
MPRGYYMFSGDVTGDKSHPDEAAATDHVLFSPKDLRIGKRAASASSRRLTFPCICKHQIEFGSKLRRTDYVCLPLSRMFYQTYDLNLSRTRARRDKNGGTSVPLGGPPSSSPRNLILIVDDEEAMRQIKGDYLGRMGYKIIEAEDGCAGVEAAARERPQLILMNYLMPKMDGLTAIEIIRQQRALRQIPIVMNSACSKDEMRPAALSAGCVDYVEEPGSSFDFLENIEDYLPIG